MAENIKIGIKGDADFSQVEHSAKETADRVAQTLQGAPIKSPFQPKEAEDFHSAVTQIERALKATGQAGKAFSDIQFPTGQFEEAEKHLDRIKDRIEKMRHESQFGRAIIQRASEHGLDTERPQEWTPERFRSMYRDPRIAEMNWRRFMGPGYGIGSQQGAEHGPGHRPGGLAVGAQLVGRQALGMAGNMTGGSGLLSAGLGARGAMAAAGGGAMAATGIGAAIAAVGAGGVALAKGYEEHKKTLEAVDSQYKAIGSKDGFGGLIDRTRELGDTLQMSQSEAARLADQFIKTSNASDSEQALTQAGYGGQFARAFGMQPGEGVSAFGRARRAGIGETDQEMQKFAMMLSQTIQGSGMEAQSSQVMEQMVGYLANIEASLGREATMTEAQGYSDMLRALYGPDGGMSSQAAGGILSGLSGFGSGKSPIDEAMSMMAYSDALGGDYGKIKFFQEQPMSATPNSVFGEGGDKTRFEMIMETAMRNFGDQLSEDPRLAFGAAYDMMGYGTTTQGKHAYDMHQRQLQGLPDVDPNRDLSLTDADRQRAAQAGLTNAMADAAGGMASDIALRIKETLVDATETFAKGIEVAEGAINGFGSAVSDTGDNLKAAFEPLRWMWESGVDAAEFSGRAAQATLDLNQQIGRGMAGAASTVGSAIVPPAGASVNPTPYSFQQGVEISPPGAASGSRAGLDSTPEPQARAGRSPFAAGTPGGAPEQPSTRTGASDREDQARGDYAPLLDMIGQAEAPGGYDVWVGQDQPTDDLSQYTVDEIIEQQAQRQADGKGTPVGRYQILDDTLKMLRERMSLNGDEPFTDALQDKMGVELLRKRGLEDWERGDLSDDAYQHRLSKEWAGLPKDASEISYYHGTAGNRATISDAEVDEAFQRQRQQPEQQPEQQSGGLTPALRDLRVKADLNGRTATLGELGVQSFDDLQDKGGQAFDGGYNNPETLTATSWIAQGLGSQFNRVTAQNDGDRRHRPGGHDSGYKADFTFKEGLSVSAAEERINAILAERGLEAGKDYKLHQHPGSHMDFRLLEPGKEKVAQGPGTPPAQPEAEQQQATIPPVESQNPVRTAERLIPQPEQDSEGTTGTFGTPNDAWVKANKRYRATGEEPEGWHRNPDTDLFYQRAPDTPPEIKQQQEAQRQQAVSAAADLNVNINSTKPDGSVSTTRYNLNVGEPRVAGSSGMGRQDRAVWNYAAP